MEHRVLRTVIVGNGTGGVDAAGGHVKDLAANEIGIYNAETNEAISAATTYAEAPKIYIAVGIDADNVRKTPVFDGAQITSWKGDSYRAPANQVTDIELSAYTPLANTEYVIRVRFESPILAKIHSRNSLVTNFRLTTGDTAPSIGDFVDDFVDVINANSVNNEGKYWIVASNNTNDLRLTGVAIGTETVGEDPLGQVRFYVGLKDGFDDSVTQSEVTAMDYGAGTYRMVKPMEDWTFGYDVSLNRVSWPVPTTTSLLSAAGEYDEYDLEFFDEHKSALQQVKTPIRVVILIPQGTAQGPLFEEVMNSYIESTPAALPPVVL